MRSLKFALSLSMLKGVGPSEIAISALLKAGVTTYYEQDGISTVGSLTDSGGALVRTYTYETFGKLTATTGVVSNSLQYTGRDFDDETGLYYYRARYYDPAVGRFVSADPILFDSGDNFYAYTNGNPVNGINASSIKPI